MRSPFHAAATPTSDHRCSLGHELAGAPWVHPSPPAGRRSSSMVPSQLTVSTSTMETVQATHLFDILGYSNHKGIGVNNCIRSGAFSVGGHHWSIRFYPDGRYQVKDATDYISVYLDLMDEEGDILLAFYDLNLVDHSTGQSSSVHKAGFELFTEGVSHGWSGKIDASRFVQGDRLTIECVVNVVKEPEVTVTKWSPEIEVPPSDAVEHLSQLLEDEEGFDVSFIVGEESFSAHRSVLAMRSPVFRAELFGQMREAKTMQPITIQDMQPAVFRALLHFIYTDSLGDLDLEGDKNTEMIRHLLVAADIYAMERLKLVCQSFLCKNLTVDTVATTLALADQQSCDELKEACFEIITCSNSMDAVVASQGYQNLKRSCPYILVEALERRTRFCGKRQGARSL